MKRKEIEEKYGVRLDKAYITGGADVQPSDWLRDDVIDSLSDYTGGYVPVPYHGGLYVMHFTADMRHGEVIPVYGGDWGRLSEDFAARLSGGEFEFAHEISGEYDDESVEYFFMSHGCLFVIDCEERRAPRALHNDAQVLMVWQAPDADPAAARADIVEKLEEGLDDIMEDSVAELGAGGIPCCSVVSTEMRGDNIGFAFWYVRGLKE